MVLGVGTEGRTHRHLRVVVAVVVMVMVLVVVVVVLAIMAAVVEVEVEVVVAVVVVMVVCVRGGDQFSVWRSGSYNRTLTNTDRVGNVSITHKIIHTINPILQTKPRISHLGLSLFTKEAGRVRASL